MKRNPARRPPQRKPRAMKSYPNFEIDEDSGKIWMQMSKNAKYKRISPLKAITLGDWLIRSGKYLIQRDI